MTHHTSLRKPQIFAAFTAHPAKVGETYFEHFLVAMRFAALLAGAALAALCHALIPALCETTASRRIRSLHAEMDRRAHGGH